MTSISAYAVFAALAFVAAYVQTLTGFAFGLLLMGTVAVSGLLPLPEAAIVISLLTLANASMVLARGWRDIAAKPFFLSLVGGIPMIVLGYSLLALLASSSLSILRILLGAAIILSSLQLIRRSSPLVHQSHGIVFIVFGALGGIMGGLFSTAGPPLVFQFYRQPLPHKVIRETLVAIFSLNSLFRLGLVAANGDWHHHALLWALVGLPAVLVSTYLAGRWPPALSVRNMRLVVFLLLLLSAVALILPNVMLL
ncbi:sulfite exporter TauE/SafE family protein (plasmid) [Brucella intermedia]|uniref:sulfite exporter TauE/SafE family protein n=1 Tax=Brucella intermedia TaxID=94625 RepID=UPI000DD84BF2|nr:sulfite exporter TauE/SafE family protein [Brucella intermedia]WLF99814.1 sulfite exporter TauE/SafE family protein [Brucella intermedia]